MRTVLTHSNAPDYKFKGEVNDKPSETIPDQAVSPAELLRRFATGQPLGFKNVTPIYDDDEGYDIPEFYKMSKLDRLHALQNNSTDLVEKTQAFNMEKEAYKKQKAEAKKAEAKKADKIKEQVKEPTQERSDAQGD